LATWGAPLNFDVRAPVVNENPEFPVIQVLGQDGPVMVANVSGASNPVAIIDDTILDKLAVQCRNAKAEALANPGDANVGAVLELCATLNTVLEIYKQARNKYYGGIGDERQKAALLREFEQAVKALKNFPR
jgi:hypothetical protein